MVRGLVPLGVGFHAHQAAQVVVQVQVPGRGVVVLLVAGVLGQRVQAAFLVERGRQGREAQALVEPLALLHLPLSTFLGQYRVKVQALHVHHRAPILAPAVGQPVGRQVGGHLFYLVFLGQLVAGVGVQLAVERPQFGVYFPHQGHHFVPRQAIVRGLVSEIVGVAQGPYGLVTQVAQVQQAVFQRRANGLAGFPDLLAFRRVVLVAQQLVEVVGGNGLAGVLVVEAVELFRLGRLGANATLHHVGHRLGVVGGVVKRRLQLLGLNPGQVGLVLKQFPQLLDIFGAAREGGHALVGAGGGAGVGRVAGNNPSVRAPLRFGRSRVKAHVFGVVTRQELVGLGAVVGWGGGCWGGGCRRSRGYWRFRGGHAGRQRSGCHNGKQGRFHEAKECILRPFGRPALRITRPLGPNDTLYTSCRCRRGRCRCGQTSDGYAAS